ncbi:hypothetical protein AWN76_018170 [Rhodothermaceae bacterium RA]|nr:hypothetical protein AWN76_018170 [Rhodothermaceae bacterium RA]
MSPDDPPLPGSPADWLRYARSDLALARATPPPGVLTEVLCFHAQQAAEKALKAVLVHHGRAVPRTHNLTTLPERLPETLALPPGLNAAKALSVYAVIARYPADIEPVSAEECQEALRLAEIVVHWAERVCASS